MDPVRERIVKNVQQALEAVTVANGYQNTIASVQRFLQRGQTLAATPVVLIIEGDDVKEFDGPLAGAYSLVSRRLHLELVVMIRQDEVSDVRSGAEALNSLVADVRKAVNADHTRAGLAVNTEETGASEYEVEEGMPELIEAIGFDVRYRHRRTDPTVAG